MVPVYYSPSYSAAVHAFPTTRKARWIAESLAASPLVGIDLEAACPLSEEQLLATHTASYVNAVRTGEPVELAQSQGFPWDPRLWEMVLASNGGVVTAALRALETGVAGSLSSGLHHARCDRGQGYCTFNGLVIAARAAIAAGARKVLILDLDAHCGGGTHSMIVDNPNIWQVDVSVDPYDSYECGPGGRTTLDIVGCADHYLATISRRLQECAAQHFGLCLFNAGMDPHEDSPEGALPGIEEQALQERERLVFTWSRDQGVPIAFAVAGGYVKAPRMDETRLVALHRLTLQAAIQVR